MVFPCGVAVKAVAGLKSGALGVARSKPSCCSEVAGRVVVPTGRTVIDTALAEQETRAFCNS
jgi:hypothetical protein